MWETDYKCKTVTSQICRLAYDDVIQRPLTHTCRPITDLIWSDLSLWSITVSSFNIWQFDVRAVTGSRGAASSLKEALSSCGGMMMDVLWMTRLFFFFYIASWRQTDAAVLLNLLSALSSVCVFILSSFAAWSRFTSWEGISEMTWKLPLPHSSHILSLKWSRHV